MDKKLYEHLSGAFRNDVEEYVTENNRGVDFAEWLEHASPHDVMDAYLGWNGIVGWTSTVMQAAKVLLTPGAELSGEQAKTIGRFRDYLENAVPKRPPFVLVSVYERLVEEPSLHLTSFTMKNDAVAREIVSGLTLTGLEVLVCLTDKNDQPINLDHLGEIVGYDKSKEPPRELTMDDLVELGGGDNFTSYGLPPGLLPEGSNVAFYVFADGNWEYHDLVKQGDDAFENAQQKGVGERDMMICVNRIVCEAQANKVVE